MNEPIKVFLSYSHKDEELRQELISHLSGLQHQGLIEPWHDRNISAGSEWADQIDENLEQADIILFLVSADFINSRYCYSIEMKRALERHRAKTACTIPVIIRDCDWKSTDLHQLNGIPRDNRHVTGWGDKFARDSAWRQVSEEIGKVAKQIWGERNTQITAAQKAKARQEFQTKAENFYADGVMSPIEQRLLNRTQQELGLEETEAEEILRVIAAAYRQHQTNLEDYRQTLIDELAGQNELRVDQRALLQQLQAEFKISDSEADQIEQKVLAGQVLAYQQAQEAADRQSRVLEQQNQAAVEHEQNLQKFCAELKRAVATGYPFHEQVEAGLRSVQQSLNLTDTDVAPIKADVLAPAQATYLEQIQQQTEQQSLKVEILQLQNREHQVDKQAPVLDRETRRNLKRKYKGLQIQQPLMQEEAEIIEYRSSRGGDYIDLKNLLQSQRWKEADQVTTIKLLQASNSSSKGYFNEESINSLPINDLKIVDCLWKIYSNNRFGFSMQKQIWEKCNCNKGKFGESIGWRGKTMWDWKFYKDLDFSACAPRGQFPTLKNQTRRDAVDSCMDTLIGGAGIDRFSCLYEKIKYL